MPSVRAEPLLALVGSDKHREVARRAARKSLVMLKNNDSTLPISPTANVLVAGTGADSIEMQTGGWTITWQGTGNGNETFLAQHPFAGIEQAMTDTAGSAVLASMDPLAERPDVAIVVFGETPYAEGQGDVETLAWQQEDQRDLGLLRKLKSQGIPVVAVLLSGRPMWMNAELNAATPLSPRGCRARKEVPLLTCWSPAQMINHGTISRAGCLLTGRMPISTRRTPHCRWPITCLPTVMAGYAEPGEVGQLNEVPVGRQINWTALCSAALLATLGEHSSATPLIGKLKCSAQRLRQLAATYS